jgi:phosphoglycerate dehydrogenase-like enzyme
MQESDDLYYLSFGLLGAGRIGKEVVKRVKAFGAKVIYHDVVRAVDMEEALGVEHVTFDELLSRVDVLSIHTPLTPQTRGVINAAAIEKMKRNAVIINTARGEIIDERALADALEKGRIRGAGLDALTQEPPREGHVFYKLGDRFPNLVLTPHVGFGRHTFDLMVRAAAEDVARVLQGEVPKYSINAREIMR